MSGLFLLAWRQISHHRTRSVVLVLCIAISAFLPTLTTVLVDRYDAELRSRAARTPLVAGARGSRFDLVLASLYFRTADLQPIPFSEYEAVRDGDFGIAVPLNLRFTARGRPIVACGADYFEVRALRAAKGTLPLRMGDAVLGSAAADEIGLGPGDHLFSDQRELYDISKPPALKMRVTGVLAETGTVDDQAVFVDVKTAWILEGIAHGHDSPEKIPEGLVMERSDGEVRISPAMVEYNEVTPDNIASFHYHGDTSGLPLTSVLVFPRDHKARTLVKARVNARPLYQMVVPAEVVDELMARVFEIKAFLDVVSALMIGTTGLLIGLVVLLSVRMRSAEIEALDRIGCSRSTVVKLIALELVLLLAVAVLLAAGLVLLALAVLPDLVQAL